MIDHLKTMAGYNKWANDRLSAAAAELSEEDYFKDRGAFFGSIHGTLNHIMLADKLWRGRIEGEPFQADGLDQILEPTRDGLKKAREEEDQALIDLVERSTEADLANMVAYKSMLGWPGENTLQDILVHVFNHATHHRGQAHGLLSQVPYDPPPLDLMIYLRDRAGLPIG